MRASLLKNSRIFIVISLIAVIFALTAACGGSSEANAPVASGPSPTAAPAAVLESTAPTSAPAVDVPAEPTEPTLVNTPGPVTSTAPDFTLTSIQGDEYSLSQFRGDKPVAVVFYRAYW